MRSSKIDGITLEVMKNSFYTIAEEMGVTLIRTALSTNIKDRVDCSTAIYTKEGELVAQAEHVPLHLGLMPSVVKEVLKMYPEDELKEGDAILINDPYISGSHLPDIFMISPIFYRNELIAIAANIAHHVDVGGLTPGSMSVKATEIFQEGIRLPAIRVRKNGVLDSEVIRLLEKNVRTGEEVLGDIYAQLAANSVAEKGIIELVEKYSKDHVFLCMKELMNYSDRRMRNAIEKVTDGEYTFTDYLEGDGITEDLLKICTKVIVDRDTITVDFTGSNEQTKGPVNSTHGVTSACVFYALKSLLEPDVPPNAGTYRSIEIIAPKGTIVNPNFPAPVSNANSNTSQRIADTIFGALADILPEKSMAACSGTMNGFSIGGFNKDRNKYFSYVETYGGGQGALTDMDGMDGVHTNMTNTLNTPVEVIEQSFPFIVNKYALVDGSGGPGKHRGGLGLERELVLLGDEYTVTLMSDRQNNKPWGLFGGHGGENSSCTVITPEGERKELSSKVTMSVPKNTTIILQTAGGGGYGTPIERNPDEVLKDVVLGHISVDEALHQYSVVIDEKTLKINYQETNVIRNN
ncbi:hydantoinase B/oxoprolinase family protein [Oceanobacillus bengalensis]|uniref:Hydantoinase B/oxoprolinase family protein n=1 Tax=Oceanobacillus bengalensis TaxID=1435466 RepID=A0A494YSV7_9BACI|nr:hydantoinase B/oxoprolinase family protein [Oceanobacillus bengalensis]RKQ12951.1 hydantoinase B/oxoprolinase family protein [Oceanobacillus bengalensis]